jgi:alpha-beta hydrolase superfamily lysophospholipase
VEYRGWPELYHEIHNEPEQAEVLEVMVEWLNGKR